MWRKAISGLLLLFLAVNMSATGVKPAKLNANSLEKPVIVADVDSRPMFHHDVEHLGYFTPTAPTTNQTLWTYATGGPVFSSPAVAGVLVYVGSSDGKVYAFGLSEKITFMQIGVSLDVAGTVLVVDDTSYGINQLPTSFHWPMHSVHTFAFQTPLLTVGATKQYIWTGTTGLSFAQSDSINVTASEEIVGNYKIQTVSASVGGFSVSLTGYGTAKPSSFYLTVLAMLSVAFATVRRKTRKKR